MGIIIAVVAALLIHMERKAVTHMKPSMMEVIASPDNIKARKASLLCRPGWTNVEVDDFFSKIEFDEVVVETLSDFLIYEIPDSSTARAIIKLPM